MHAGYLFCNWHSLNTNCYGNTFGGMPGSFNSSQINACVVGIGVLGPRFIVSSEGLGLHNMLPPRGFEPGTSRMPGKRCTAMLQLPKKKHLNYITMHKERKKLNVSQSISTTNNRIVNSFKPLVNVGTIRSGKVKELVIVLAMGLRDITTEKSAMPDC